MKKLFQILFLSVVGTANNKPVINFFVQVLMRKLVLYLQSRWSYVFPLCFISFLFRAQTVPNLVNNYSFEQYTSCPGGMGGVRLGLINYWFSPIINGTPDFYHSCSSTTNSAIPNNLYGSQLARTGNAYVGGVYYSNTFEVREDIESGLKQSLGNGKKYCVTFYISLGEYSHFATSNIGVYFSNDSIKNYWPAAPLTNYFVTPSVENPSTTILSDTINWMQVRGFYTANGTEKFIMIGNLRNDASTNLLQTKPSLPGNAYYYFDDISVVEINPSNAHLKDTIFICPNDSIVLGTDSTWDATYQWQSTAAGMAALSCTNCPNPIVKPSTTTKYYLTKQQCSSTTIDSVTVVVLTPTTQANAGNDKTICIGDYVQIGTQDSLAFTNYTWQFAGLSCSNCAQPYVNPTVSTTYTVQRTECTNITSDTVRVIVDDCDPIFILPNVFTPNYDDVNDTWGINFSTVNSHIKDFKMSIYDRWGLLVYSTNSELNTPNSKWDGHTTSGEECNAGVYYYIITFEKNNEHILLKGHLSLFR